MHRQLVGLLAMMMSLGMTQLAMGKIIEVPDSPPMERQNWFMENNGQVRDQFGNPRPEIDFRLKAHGQLSVFVHNQGMDYQWNFPEDSFSYRLEFRILGTNPHSRPLTENPCRYKEHYYRNGESISSQGWEKIIYPDIYPGVDWIVYKNHQQLEYDFLVHPGADFAQIQLEYRGAEELSLSKEGELIVRTPYTHIKESAPIAFLDNGRKIDCGFLLEGNRVRFRTPPHQGGLRIDPVVEWGTYLGGNLNDIAHMVKRSPSGKVYLTGGTSSLSDIATVGAFHQSYQGGSGGLSYLGDAFLAQFDSTGQCQWSTYFGGSDEDQGFALATDGDYSVYLAGSTRSSSGIALSGAHQSSIGGGADAFLAKFRSDGTLIWSTYYGGTGDENLWVSLSAREAGPVYLAFPTSSSTGISSPGTHQEVFGGFLDVGLVQFDSSGAFQWGTYFGGSGLDIPFSLQTDAYGHLYMAGFTGSSQQIASPGAYQSVIGGGDDGYLAKFNDQGQLVWSTYYGGSGTDRLTAVLPVGDSAVYLLGVTNSSADIATATSHQNSIAGGDDAFFARMDTSGQRIWASYFGGPANEYLSPSLTLGVHGDLYFGGSTQSNTGIASPGAMNPLFQGGFDGMLARFSPQGQIKWSSYVGGPGVDMLHNIETDPYGFLYLCGETTSGSGIADSSSHQSSFGGGYRDALVMQISDCDTPASPGTIQGPAMACHRLATVYTVAPVPGAQSYQWSLPAGWSGSSQTNQIVVYPGSQPGTLSVQALSYCSASLPSTLSVQPALVASISHSGMETICPGDSLRLRSGSQATHYEWLWNGNPISTDSVLLASDTGIYQLVVTNSHCTDSSATLEIRHWATSPPQIQYDGNYLYTGTHYTQYQWYFDGHPLTGAHQHRWKPVAMGPYQVVVLDSNGCLLSSEIYPLSFRDPSLSHSWRIYPNPVEDEVYMEGMEGTDGRIDLINAQGQRVLSTKWEPRISLSGIPSGIYWLVIRDERGHRLHSQILVKD